MGATIAILDLQRPGLLDDEADHRGDRRFQVCRSGDMASTLAKAADAKLLVLTVGDSLAGPERNKRRSSFLGELDLSTCLRLSVLRVDGF
jgi:hypothetical protein